MVTLDDVAGLVMTVLSANPASANPDVPGGAWLGRAPDTPPAYPYAVFDLKGGEKENFSGGIYIQPWVLSIGAYAQMDGEAIVPSEVEQALNEVLVTITAQASFQATALRNPNDKILHSRPIDDDGEFDPTLRNGQDVFIAGITAEILVQGDRNVT